MERAGMEENGENRRKIYEVLPIYLFILLQLATYFKFVSIKILHNYNFMGFDDLISLILRSRIPRHGMVQFDFAMAFYVIEFVIAILVCENKKMPVKLKTAILTAILIISLPYISIFMFLK